MTERFKKAYDALVAAFFDGTLGKGTCLGCACGNIIYSAIGTPVTRDEFLSSHKPHKSGKNAYEVWAEKRRASSDRGYIAREEYLGEINEAGYTTEEFVEIENAFENNTCINYKCYDIVGDQEILEDQYDGLCAVVDVLLRLDGETIEADQYKQKFREHPKLIKHENSTCSE